jgi:hypothetical protein
VQCAIARGAQTWPWAKIKRVSSAREADECAVVMCTANRIKDRRVEEHVLGSYSVLDLAHAAGTA